METELVAWAAGLFEGEGSIGFARRKSLAHSLTPRACLSSTDEDVVERFREIVGIGSVRPLAPDKNWKPHYKRVWRWQADGPAVISLMDAFAPFLGERRSGQVGDIRRRYEASLIPGERVCPGCGTTYRPKSRYRGRTQIYCERLCGRRVRERA